NVVLSVTGGDPTEITVAPSSLTFTPSNWNVAQTVIVTGVDDALADGDQMTAVVLSVVDGSSPVAYRDVPDRAVNVTTVDNEPAVPGFNTAESNGGTVVSESGTSDSFTVVLTKQPAAQVVISVVGNDSTEATASPTSLTFTPATWNIRQTVTVTGVDDSIADGNQMSEIVLSVVDGLSAEEYRPIADRVVSVTTLDNEATVTGFLITETGGTTVVAETGTTDSFTLALSKQPSDSVTISVTGNDASEVTISPANLTFTAANWAAPQTVMVTGVDDTLADGPQVTDVVLSVIDSFSAVEYRAVADQVVRATTLDDEPAPPGLSVLESGGATAVTESGGTDAFLVALTKQPSAAVTIAVTSTNTGEVAVTPANLTFTPSNWDQPQVVTVTGVDDNVPDGDRVVPVLLSVVKALSAEEYRAVQDRSVSVTNTDDDASSAPAPVGPANNAQLNNLGPLLLWTQEAGTTWFQVQVIPFNNDGPGIDLIIGDTTQVAASQYQVREPDFGGAEANYVMLPGMSYTWRVRTTKAIAPLLEGQWTAWSTLRSFRTGGKSSVTISRVSPQANGAVASRTPTLVWANSDPTVFYYEVQVSKDQDFGGGVFLYWELRHGGVTSPMDSYTIPGQYPLENETTYFWRVRPRIQGDGAPVAWSSTFSFHTP
ncbi:MAG: hypothetical protein AAB289_07455, partial [Chloroflexota bacterium]